MSEVMPSAVVVVVESDRVDDVLNTPGITNRDAIELMKATREQGGFAVFTGPIWVPDGGVYGMWVGDKSALIPALSLVCKRLDSELDDTFSEWMVLANDKVTQRVTRYLRKKTKYH